MRRSPVITSISNKRVFAHYFWFILISVKVKKLILSHVQPHSNATTFANWLTLGLACPFLFSFFPSVVYGIPIGLRGVIPVLSLTDTYGLKMVNMCLLPLPLVCKNARMLKLMTPHHDPYLCHTPMVLAGIRRKDKYYQKNLDKSRT